MKVQAKITDKEILHSIDPIQILAYLQSKGAYKVEEIAEKAAYFEYYGINLLVPLAKCYAGYILRIAELLSSLEKAEGRSQIRIWKDIVSPY